MVEMRQTYTETVIDHAMNPQNVGSIPGTDGFATIFWTDGCSTSIACGSMATEMIRSRNVTEALVVNQSRILEALVGLSEDSPHCALLAADAVRAVIRDYLAMKRDQWKKAYRR
jgi:nitrogen fixation NifU-like protein